MYEIDAAIKTVEELWADDKRLLKHAGIDASIADSPVPTEQGVRAILNMREQAMQRSPRYLMQPSSLLETAEWLTSDVERIWGAKLEKRPKLEIVESDALLDRINAAAAQIASRTGWGATPMHAPPDMDTIPWQETILVPREYIFLLAKGQTRATLTSEFEMRKIPWTTAELEYGMFEHLSLALFRQLRGEWGAGYVDVYCRVGEQRWRTVSRLQQAIAQYASERIAAERPQLVLPALASKILFSWGDRYNRSYFQAVDALAPKHSPAQIAMVDEVTPHATRRALVVEFDSAHPYDAMKRKMFLKKRP